MNRFLAFWAIVSSTACIAQAPRATSGPTVRNNGTKGIQISFHVTSVRYEADPPDFCGTVECSATKITVEGYADGMQPDSRVMFVLTCDKLVSLKPAPKVAVSCGSVHANNDYDAWVFDNSISFWPREKYTPPPLRGSFKIVSEKEVSKPSK
jgi:hypothetical protein